MKKQGQGRLLILLALLSLGLLANSSHWLPSATTAHAQSSSGPPNTTVFVTTASGSNNITDPSNIQKTITFDINVSLSPPINAFKIFLSYNNTVLTDASVTYKGNVLGPNAQLQRLCIDNLKQPGSIDCQPPDAGGVISIALILLGNATSPSPLTSGLLFQVTFNVVAMGLAQIHLLPNTPDESQLAAGGLGGSGGYVPFSTQDGYYTNMACGPVACRPPVVSFTWSPVEPSLGSPANFNATATERNPGAKITSYVWDWGDGNPPSNPSNQSITSHAFVVNTFGLGGPCVTNGACAVTLSVHDTDLVTWKLSLVVHILHLAIKIGVSEFTIDQRFGVVPGAILHLSANIVNFSTIAEKANLTITVDQTVLARQNFTLTAQGSASGKSGHLNATWPTAGLVPRAYTITAYVCLLPHCGIGDRLSGIESVDTVKGSILFGENVTRSTGTDSAQTSYVVLIVSEGIGSFSLSLLQTTGLGILIIVAAALGLARFLKKPSYEKEPLD